MYEYRANFHQHTTHSDGTKTHEEVIKAGQKAGLDVMVFTDHNVYVPDKEGWYDDLFAFMGIEVNDVELEPEINHYLCLGVDRDLNEYAKEPQALVDAVNECGGVGFIAHPFEIAAPLFGQDAYSWHNWDISGYVGLEIWNYMTEYKAYTTTYFGAIRSVFTPDRFIKGPFPETLKIWDDLMKTGQKVVAIGGADAHGQIYNIGPIHKVVFPYEHVFKAVRTHLLMKNPLSKDVAEAKEQVLNTLREGHCFVAYDQIGDTTGFQFTATHSDNQIIFTDTNTADVAIQGDEIALGDLKLIKMTATTPQRAEIRLLKDGEVIAKKRGQALTYLASEPGVYRVECYLVHKLQWRGWIYSNPIYVRG